MLKLYSGRDPVGPEGGATVNLTPSSSGPTKGIVLQAGVGLLFFVPGAGFRSLADAWADTTTPHGRLMFVVLGGLAEFERELIRARTSEGRKRARARGVHMGRPPALNAFQRQEALTRRDTGETLTDIARTYGVSHTTISRLRSSPRTRSAG